MDDKSIYAVQAVLTALGLPQGFIPQRVAHLTPELLAKIPKVWVPPADPVAIATPSFTLTRDQDQALKAILEWNIREIRKPEDRFFVLGGYSGTGKTTLLKFIRDIGGFGFSALTNKAAKVVAHTLGCSPLTVYSVLGIRMVSDGETMSLQFPDTPPKALRGSTLVVDEASMTNKELFRFICKAAVMLDLRILFVGDPAQLPPVGERRSPVWRLDCSRAFLRQVVRYDNAILTLATALRGCVKSSTFDLRLKDFADGQQVHYTNSRSFDRIMLDEAPKHKVLAWRNKTVEGYNNMIRQHLGFEDDFCVGDKLMIASPVLDDFDSILHTIDDECDVLAVDHTARYDIEAWGLSCSFSGSLHNLLVPTDKGANQLQKALRKEADAAKAQERKIGRQAAWKPYWQLKNTFHNVRYGFAQTVHRSQGSTYPSVMVDSKDILYNSNEREACQCFYVGASRPSDVLYLQ